MLNADDPVVADLGRDREDALFFGVEDDGVALASMQHASDAKHCRRCGAPYVYDAHYMGHLGRYHCDSCGARRPQPRVRARDIRLQGVQGASFTLEIDRERVPVRLPLPGLYNVYNALGAAALAHALGIAIADIGAGLETVRAAFGRAENIRVDGRQVSIMLVKNPAGANEVLRTLALEPGEHHLLAVLNDAIADGRDVSWVWDADFEVLVGHLRRVTCSGTRAAEMALRLKYAGVPEDADHGRGGSGRRPSTSRSPAARDGCSRCRRTPPCSPCARCSSAAAQRRARSHERTTSSGTTSNAAATTSTCRCGASWRPPPRARSSTSAPARGGSRSTLRAAASRSSRWTRTPGCSAPSRTAPATAPVTAVVADARDFTLDREFGLVLVPMQSLQLFEGAEGRAAFLSRARSHLRPGGTVAIAIADVLDGVGGEYVEPPPPDLREIDGTVYSSRPVAVYQDAERVAIQRVREVVQNDGTLEASDSTVWLDTLTPSELERQAREAGLRVLRRRSVPETDEYVGSTVVMLGA